MSYRIVLSDAGDILFQTGRTLLKQKDIIHMFLAETDPGISLDEAYRLFRPYKILSQTTMEEKDSFELFVDKYQLDATYQQYLSILPNGFYDAPMLYEGVTQFLEGVHDIGLPFVVLTDAFRQGKELLPLFAESIIHQFEERGVYGQDGFNIGDYVASYISSRDVGCKKPDPRFFRYGLDCIDPSLKFEDALFIAHDYDEIFGANDLGIAVAAYNFQEQEDSGQIYDNIAKRNCSEEFSPIYIARSFGDVLKYI